MKLAFFNLEVPVGDAFGVQEGHALQEFDHNAAELGVVEGRRGVVAGEVARGAELHDHHQVAVLGLGHAVHRQDARVRELREHSDLVLEVGDALFGLAVKDPLGGDDTAQVSTPKHLPPAYTSKH